MSKRSVDWLLALSYVAIIYLVLPIAPTVWHWMGNSFGRGAVARVPICLLAMVGLVLLLYMIAMRGEKGLFSYFMLLIILVVTLYMYKLKRDSTPAEKVHFIQYGLVSALWFRALYNDIKGRSIYLFAFMVSCLCAVLDEYIQHLLPNRFFELEDIWMNIGGCVLGLATTTFIIKPKLN